MATLKPAADVNTAAVTAVGLIGGWLTARETGVRSIGGVLLGAAGVLAGRTWLRRNGAGTTAVLSVIYVAAFGASHPLAKRIGPWPAVLSVSLAASGAAWALSDRRA